MEVSAAMLNRLRNSKIKKKSRCYSLAPDCIDLLEKRCEALGCTKTYYLESLILGEAASESGKFGLTINAINLYLHGKEPLKS